MGDKVLNNKKNKFPNENIRSHKMYESIIRGLQEAIDDTVDRSKYNRIDLDNLPLSTEDLSANIIPGDTGST